jgi:death-on-curing protein
MAQTHPFINGDKRTAFAVTYTFLAVNGVRISADADETYGFLIVLHASGTFEFTRLCGWLRANITNDAS